MLADVSRFILRNATKPFRDYCKSSKYSGDTLRINPSDHSNGETETIFQSHFDADWMKCSAEPRRGEGTL